MQPSNESFVFRTPGIRCLGELDDAALTGFHSECISLFSKAHFPNIKFAEDFEKNLLVDDLVQSYNFARTHSVISKLSKYTSFNAPQVNSIVSAAITNPQIASIVDDDDVREFLGVDRQGTSGYYRQR
jgi:hypothetical protein